MKVKEQMKKLEAENSMWDTLEILNECMARHRLGLISVIEKELIRLKDMVEVKTNKAWARLVELGVDHGADAHPPLSQNSKELEAMVDGSFSTRGDSDIPTDSGLDTIEAFSHNCALLLCPWAQE